MVNWVAERLVRVILLPVILSIVLGVSILVYYVNTSSYDMVLAGQTKAAAQQAVATTAALRLFIEDALALAKHLAQQEEGAVFSDGGIVECASPHPLDH